MRDYWLPHIESLGADERTILIGHSSGAVAAMRYAETAPAPGVDPRRRLSTLILADGFEAASGYYEAEWQWQRIRDNQRWIADLQLDR